MIKKCRGCFPNSLLMFTSIETHPFKPEDFTRDDLFVVRILKEGIEVTN